MKIAIDGPSGSGKSTIAKQLAQILKINYLDTGSMYRAIAYKLNNKKIDSDEKLYRILEQSKIEIENNIIYLDGQNIQDEIRKEEIGKFASIISKEPIVREYLVNMQREIAKNGSIIMDGRDIGSVVMPDADYKFFLTADLATRARRRKDQIEKDGINIELEQIQNDLKDRDFQDINRKTSPLVKVEDAIEIDNSNLDIDQTIGMILDIIGVEDVL